MSQNLTPWISVVIPIKDERDNLHPLTTQLQKVLSTREETKEAPFEIIYVNDGSTDGSEAILSSLSKEYPEVRVVHFDQNYGQTAGFIAGFHHARGNLIVTLDGDLQYDPADIAKLLPFTSQYDLVCGRRQKRTDHLIRKLSSRLAFFVRNAVIHDGIHDTGCSLKIFQRRVFAIIPPFKGMHRFFPALAQMHGFSVKEVLVQHFSRAHGYSKYGVGNRLFAGLYDLIAVRWMQKRYVQYHVKNLDGSGKE